MKPQDPRIKALYSIECAEFFHAVTHTHEIWKPDPFDVELIHQNARDAYQHLLDRISALEQLDAGRILLLHGESGAGKTHLMRAFRSTTHEHGIGYFSYMQMATEVSNYSRYILRNSLDALEKPYYSPWGDSTGLMRLSRALIEHSVIPTKVREFLQNENNEVTKRIKLVYRAADYLLNEPIFAHIDIDLLRALLLLQLRDPALTSRVMKLLRCEPLGSYDQELVGGMPSRDQDDDPLRMLQAIALLIHKLSQGALVICIDQLEEMEGMTDAANRFRHLIQTVIILAEIPNVIVVISCLEGFYFLLKQHLLRSHQDRIEKDPPPITLASGRTETEIEAIIQKRIQGCLDRKDIAPDPAALSFPFTTDQIQQLVGMRTRDVLGKCRDHLLGKQEERVITSPCDKLWNEHKNHASGFDDEDTKLLTLLAHSIEHCTEEISGGYRFKVNLAQSSLLVDLCNANGQIEQALVLMLCQKSAQGGALQKQIDELSRIAANRQISILPSGLQKRRPVALRSTEYPSNPTTKIAKHIAAFIAQGGQRVVVADADWRDMQAMRSFRDMHAQTPCFADWLKDEKPLTSLPSLREMLRLDELACESHLTILPPLPDDDHPDDDHNDPSTISVPDLAATGDKTTLLGYTLGMGSKPLTLKVADLSRHAAFLGGSGSGKTTLALTLLEQLLLQNIPVIVIDRKGDLSSYACMENWQTKMADATRQDMRARLQQRIEVAVYTPGSLPDQGRALNIPIAPPGLAELTSSERQQLAQLSAAALGGLLGYKQTGLDRRTAMLGQAIAALAEVCGDQTLSLDLLMTFIDSHDPALLNALGHLDAKNLKILVQDLQTLSFTNGALFQAEGETLDINALLGRGSGADLQRTRLSVISTAFLGSNDRILFWVAQFLLELGRYVIRNPSHTLQAVVFFDEADLYLPAQSKPATKEPMESLLKKARSAGLCMMLATQSPGDLDYKSRDQISSWFVGKIKEETAIKKLKPMLSEAAMDISGKLATQQTGEFYLLNAGNVTSFKANMSLIHAQQLPADEISRLAYAGSKSKVS